MHANTVFESPYGRLQPPYFWMSVAIGVVGLLLAPVGLLWNQGWQMGNRPMDPWAATTIIEILALGALAVGAYGVFITLKRRDDPQRIAVTTTGLVVPKSPFSRQELILPFAEIDTKVFDVGFVKQLQIKHGRRKLLITSALFPTNDDFDHFVEHLPR